MRRHRGLTYKLANPEINLRPKRAAILQFLLRSLFYRDSITHVKKALHVKEDSHNNGGTIKVFQNFPNAAGKCSRMVRRKVDRMKKKEKPTYTERTREMLIFYSCAGIAVCRRSCSDSLTSSGALSLVNSPATATENDI